MDHSASVTRTRLWAALDQRKDATYADVLKTLDMQDNPLAQKLAGEHAMACGGFGTLPAFVRWFEKNWACTLDMTAALGHEPWMSEGPRGRTPSALAHVALRQIKATLCGKEDSMSDKWQMWGAHPDMGYHTKVIRALLQEASDEQKQRIRKRLSVQATPPEAVTPRIILGAFQAVLGTHTVLRVLRSMKSEELKYRMAQRTAVQFLGMLAPTAVKAKRKRKAAPPSSPRASLRRCLTCGSPLRAPPHVSEGAAILAQE